MARFNAQFGLITMLAALLWSQAGSAGAGIFDEPFCPRRLAPGIYIGPEPETKADITRLQRLGVREIIDLRRFDRRDAAREQYWANEAGICYRHLPIGLYPRFPDLNMEQTLRRMRCRSRGTVYIHCSLGHDRTGLIAAIYRWRYLGWSAQAAFCEMERTEFNSRLGALDRYFWDSVGRGRRHNERR